MTMLRIEGLHAGYGGIPVLYDVSLEVAAGSISALIGANGAGKTTLFRVIAGLLPLVRGSIRLGEKNIAGIPPHRLARLGIGQVPEGRRVFATLSVLDNLLVAVRYGAGVAAGPEQKRLLEEVYTLFPVLQETRHRLAGTLSGGQQQMLAIGRALMLKPKLLLLDEPSLGLAPLVVELIFETIQILNRERGRTIFLIEQNAFFALEVSTQAYVLTRGRVTLSGRSQDILASGVVQHYLGQAEPAGGRA